MTFILELSCPVISLNLADETKRVPLPCAYLQSPARVGKWTGLIPLPPTVMIEPCGKEATGWESDKTTPAHDQTGRRKTPREEESTWSE